MCISAYLNVNLSDLFISGSDLKKEELEQLVLSLMLDRVLVSTLDTS